MLAPKFHKLYFIGLEYHANSSAWHWLDPSTAPPLAPNYVKWSTDTGEPDPNTGSCSVADFRLPGYSALSAAAWAAAACGDPDGTDGIMQGMYPAICKTRAPGSVPPIPYTSTNNDTFIFSTAELAYSSASTFCMRHGGQLVSFQSQEEQLEVESAFIDMGILIPGWHTAYWLGLSTRSSSEPRVWRWTDPFVPYFTDESYTHWGTNSDGVSEPDNAVPPESCAACNYSQRFQDGVSNVGPWGWADASCSTRLPIMCRITRKGAPGSAACQSTAAW